MSNAATGLQHVLIAVANRGDRKTLFDGLDAAGCRFLHSARDAQQALALMQQDPQIQLVVADMVGDFGLGSRFGEALSRHPLWRELPLLGIVPAGTRVPRDLPLTPKAVLRSPIDGEEAMATIAGLFTATPSPAVAEVSPAPVVAAPVPVPAPAPVALPAATLEDVDPWRRLAAPLLRVNDLDETIESASDGFLKLSGYTRNELLGVSLERLLRIPDRRLRQGALRCHNGRLLTVAFHLETQRGSRVLSLVPLPEAQPDRRIAWADFLLKLQEPELSARVLETLLTQLLKLTQLDFAVVTAGSSDGSHELLVAHLPLADSGFASQLVDDPLHQRILDQGELLAVGERAPELAEDWPRRLHARLLYGLALKDDHQRRHGVLLVGAGRALPDFEAEQPLLRALAARIGLQLSLRHARQESSFRGLHDPLTGLPNRLLMADRLEIAIAESSRAAEQFGVLFVDLDHFKRINDHYGHNAGDHVLIGAARRLRQCIRSSDTIARYAGDEFVLILRHIVQREDVLRIADKIGRAIEAPLTLPDGREAQLSASIGIAFFPTDGSDAEALLKHADLAMYAAKTAGRNTSRAYLAPRDDVQDQHLALEAKLRQAERKRELRAFYQPKIDARNEEMIGMEALIRWENPELGLVNPGVFIPLAEETGLIVPIGEWMLMTACLDCKRWQDKFGRPLKVGVNLSAVQLKQQNLVEVVKRALAQSKLPPASLDLEVTESINVREIPNLMQTLTDLRSLGCSISIDDFGTGQSSLEYIKRFPADYIKIDQVFVRNIGVDPDDEAIVRATIDMAHNIGKRVVAEGVETEEHLRFLVEAGCQELQGFLFCRPLSASAFENLLAERERLLSHA
jgi:diguanylate cyclase (GGDEF)-like protein